MIERPAYDAVIADVKMPELSGQELYGRVFPEALNLERLTAAVDMLTGSRAPDNIG